MPPQRVGVVYSMKKKRRNRNEYFSTAKWRQEHSCVKKKKRSKCDYTLNKQLPSRIVVFKDVQNLGKLLILIIWEDEYFAKESGQRIPRFIFFTWWCYYRKIILFLISRVRFRITLFWSSSIITCFYSKEI